MNNTIELIQNMLQSSEVVKSLPIIGEIAIKDEPGYRTIFAEAGIGALITLCATYMGSKFGSKKTVKLFKEEEKFKIRENLRREFYFEYEQKYLAMHKELITLIDLIENARFIAFKCGEEGHYEVGKFDKDVNIINIKGINDIKNQVHELDIEGIKIQSQKLMKSINELKEFMSLKEYIVKYKEFIYNELESKNSDVYHECVEIDLIIISNEGELEDNKELLKKLPFIELDIDENQLKKYIESVENIINKLLKELSLELEKSKGIHKSISNEFMEQYFDN